VPTSLVIVRKEIKELVSGWGGVLYIIYRPRLERYLALDKNPSFTLSKTDPLAKASEAVHKKLGLRFINMSKEVFDAHPDPLSLYFQK
jgi:hypothetical protein